MLGKELHESRFYLLIDLIYVYMLMFLMSLIFFFLSSLEENDGFPDFTCSSLRMLSSSGSMKAKQNFSSYVINVTATE